MKQPPDYLIPLLMHLENTVLKLYEEYPRLNNKDIEWTYEALGKYYKNVMKGLSPEEPTSTIIRRQDLSDELLNAIDIREKAGLDEEIINDPDYRIGEHMIHSIPHLYNIVFKRLYNSARLWRKRLGARGYIDFLKDYHDGGYRLDLN